MSKPGPVPKRDEDRIRRNKESEDGLTTKSFSMDDDVEIPHAYFFNHEVNEMWLALRISVNVKYFEPSDWAYALWVFRQMDTTYNNASNGRPISAKLIEVYDGMLSKLLLTEADRRRLKIEANRGKKDNDGVLINAEDMFRERFEQQREA